MIILKLRRPFLIPTRFVPHTAPFTWVAKLTFVGYTQPSRYDSDYDFTTPALNETLTDIGNVYVDNVKYDEVSTAVAMAATEESYYWDITNQLIYIHPTHSKRMPSSDYDSLEVRGYCSDDVFVDDNNISFLPYLDGNISITDKADRLVYSKMAFVNNSMSLNNLDYEGEFDDLADDPTPGADGNILYISQAELNAGSKVPTAKYTGYISGDQLTKTGYKVQLKDKRAQFAGPLLTDTFNTTDYPNINTDLVGDYIPAGYGDIIGAPAYCTDGTVGTGNVPYKYCTDGTSITTAYVKVNDVWTAVTPVSTDPTNGELILDDTTPGAADSARDENNNPRDCKVDARFRDIDDPGDIMVDIIERYLGIRYTNENFDTSQWATESTGLKSIYLYIGDQCKFFECIEEIQGATDIGFRFYVNAGGKFTLKQDDINRASSKTYQYTDNISNINPSKRDFTQYATSVIIKYNKDQTSGTASREQITTYQEDTFNKYRYYQELTYESNLTSSADAQAKGAAIALDYSEARNEISFDIPWIEDIELYDVVTADLSIYKKGVKVREYLGTRVLKISGIVWNFGNDTTTLTGYDISDI